MKRAIPATLATLTCTLLAPHAIAQLPRGVDDPMELVALQRVLRAAMEANADTTVRIETFGGVRRVLAGNSGPQDGIAGPTPQWKPKQEWLDDLFGKIDPDRFAELWKDAGLDPKPDGEAFEAKDLLQLGPERLKKLMEEHEVGPWAPKDAGEQKKPGLGPLVQPGFLQAQGATTGVILSSDGWIVVSRFALNFDPSTILVTLPDGRSFTAVRGGEDVSRGLALLKIDAEGLPTPTLADPREVQVGQWAFALGRTFAEGRLPSVHIGIVSATERLFGRALQIDANTSPANYGGPVVDVHGKVLGIAVPLSPSGRDAGVDWYDSGIGFAVPLTGIGPLLDRMKLGEVLERGWLGIQLDGKHLGPGAVLQSVLPDSPAALAGLKPKDTIVVVDGEQVRNPFHLQILVSRHMAGDPLHVEFQRGDAEPTSITVFLAEAPSKEQEAVSRSEETFELPWEGDQPAEPDGGR